MPPRECQEAKKLRQPPDKAPVDDEPVTDADRDAIREGLRDVARGDVLTTEQLLRELKA